MAGRPTCTVRDGVIDSQGRETAGTEIYICEVTRVRHAERQEPGRQNRRPKARYEYEPPIDTGCGPMRKAARLLLA
eukprot:627172-Pleurochrysis_carterae.AAC.3